ncbi:MAG: hypothetical protein K6G85_06420 [Eubacterium sp.]|nr:hypothetical protein [Eubacterium sp.]
MSRTRPELSKKNKWYISKHRYYELKHFCLQYPEWVEKYKSAIRYPQGIGNTESPEWNDPTGNSVESMDIWRTKIRKVEEAAFRTDEVLGRYILKAVTEDLSFNAMKMLYEIPCEKDMYYDRYRKFFYILSNS